MKASNITTPRTLADCDFQTWADPVDFPSTRRSAWTWVDLAIAVLAFLTVMAMIGGLL